ncbi:hypothetical protein Desgi_4145 [Desulfoscipio gibsoniae DSM 7213]|uniref:Uncharacterized protein n=1 Tax=Desulfoscipio gibsoniae DSM 7213 TaxID=767817 RepID=R4KS33_9FIRM|nr:hypothetical protein Desgi_4145 [Desulfoscipio gibsoniae DSM 7213]
MNYILNYLLAILLSILVVKIFISIAAKYVKIVELFQFLWKRINKADR